NGTNLDDTFGVTAAGVVTLNTQIPVNTTGSIVTLTLAGLDGDDTFNIAGNHNLPGGVVVEGGNPSASDTLNFNASATVANAVTANLGAATVTEAGSAAVSYTGIEALNINAAGHNSTTVIGTGGDDTMSVTPTGPAALTTQLTSSAPSVGSTPV